MQTESSENSQHFQGKHILAWLILNFLMNVIAKKIAACMNIHGSKYTFKYQTELISLECIFIMAFWSSLTALM